MRNSFALMERRRARRYYLSGFNDAVTEVLRIYDEVEDKETFVDQVNEMRRKENES